MLSFINIDVLYCPCSSRSVHSMGLGGLRVALPRVFNPTAKRVYEATSTSRIRCHYRYRAKSNVTGGYEVFQTVGNPISDESTYRMVSRANRVWLVRKVISDDGKTPVLSEETRILKDAWLYADVHLEKDIQDDIFSNGSPRTLGKLP